MIRMICYDITEDKTRTKLADRLEYHAFERIQYSVFVGTISPKRWKTLWRSLTKFFREQALPTDRIYSHVIDSDEFDKMCILGHGIDRDWILQDVVVLFI